MVCCGQVKNVVDPVISGFRVSIQYGEDRSSKKQGRSAVFQSVVPMVCSQLRVSSLSSCSDCNQPSYFVNRHMSTMWRDFNDMWHKYLPCELSEQC